MPDGSDCPRSGNRTSSTYFLTTCTNCKCGCPSWSRSLTPDGDGDCSCPANYKCRGPDGSDCPKSRGSTSSTYFLPTCTNCKCKPGCPSWAKSSKPDGDGDCACRGLQVPHARRK